MKDPIVNEVRRNRMKHTKKFGGDLSAICADLRLVEVASGHKVVRLAPRKPEPPRTPRRREIARDPVRDKVPFDKRMKT